MTSRVITNAGGQAIPERILTLDPRRRRFQYEIAPSDLPLPPRDPRCASSSTPASCLVVYGTDAEPADHGPHHRRRRAARPWSTWASCSRRRPDMGRKILFVTTDQQRYDTLGCNGGTLARTPVVDGLAAEGIRYERAHPQSVVCMPSRATMLTGQYPTTHGVWMNGVPLPVDAPVGRRGAPGRRLPHRARRQGPLRAVPRPLPPVPRERPGPDRHHAAGRLPPGLRAPRVGHPRERRAAPLRPWLAREHPEAVGGFYRALDGSLQVNAAGGRRHRGAPGEGQPGRRGTCTTPTGWPTGRSPGSTRWTPTRTGSAG